MNDDGTLRAKARRAIESGLLPDRPPDRTWGGVGTGASCILCGAALTRDEVELEVEFAVGAADRLGLHMHPRCFAVWESERRLLEPERGDAGLGASPDVPDE